MVEKALFFKMSDGDKQESEFSNNCHISGKFSTESDLISPMNYFSTYNESLIAFGQETKDLFRGKFPGGLDARLLDYKGEPAKLYFDSEVCNKEFCASARKANEKLTLNKDLLSVQCRKKDLWKTYSPKYAISHWKHSDQPPIKEPNYKKPTIFSFVFYKPFQSKTRGEEIKVQQEIWMKGKQTLDQLESALFCHLDYTGLEDLSEKEETWYSGAPTEKHMKLKFDASFFFINDVFYTKGSVDLSECVRDFLKRNNVGEYTTQNMNVSIENIPIRTGRPFVYQHLGQCEHVFVLSDIWLRNPEDPRSQNSYPFINAVSNAFPKHCMLCGCSYAHWLVTNFKKLTLSRAFLCHRCFVSYCYIDGRKAGEFQAYKHIDPSVYL